MTPPPAGAVADAIRGAGVPDMNDVREAQAAWAATPLRGRLAVLCRFRRLLAEHAPELAEIVRRTTGRPAAETLSAEVLPLADACRFLEREAEALLRTRRLGRAGRPLWLAGAGAEVRREPLGVVLLVGPGNYPLFLPGVQAAQALAAGNAVLLKPGSGGVPIAARLADLLYSAGLGRPLLHVLSEDPAAARLAVARGVDKVFLTGSAQTGAEVLAELAGALTPAVMELSGCDAAFVRPDADLDLVARAMSFAFRLKCGQTCIAPRRVLVARERAADLERKLAAVARDIGPLPVPPRLAAAAARLTADAVRHGARICAGDISADDGLMTPVVVADAGPEMTLLREELFAPAVALVSVGDDEEALAVAGRCPYALGATVFGREPGASALARRVRAGIVVVNDVIAPTADPRLPFGGRGRSGFGVTRGAEGLLEMTVVKVICTRRGPRPHLAAPHENDAELFLSYIRAAHGGAGVAGWWAVLRTLLRRGRGAVAGQEFEA